MGKREVVGREEEQRKKERKGKGGDERGKKRQRYINGERMKGHGTKRWWEWIMEE